MALGHIHGPIAKLILANGLLIICMDKVFSPGLTADDTRVSILTIKNTVSGSTPGRTTDNMLGNGRMGSSTGRAFILMSTILKEQGSGRKENV